jgi:uncharacterized peroxidase-related enzyme
VAFIDNFPDDQAGELYEAEVARVGHVPNYVRVFAYRPEVYAAWQQLNGAIKASMDLRRYELATLAAAANLRSSYCALAHGRVLAERFFDPAAVRELVLDRTSAGLEPVDLVVMEFAEKVVSDAASVSEDDIERLRDLGLSDADILDVALAAAARCFFSKTLDAVGTRPDAAYNELEPGLRDALTVGRPIEAEVRTA